MSHCFSLDLLAEHKLCLDFSNPGKPPSIQWEPLSQPVSLARLASSLSIKVNVSGMNGRNTLALFVVSDPASEAEQTNEANVESSNSERQEVPVETPPSDPVVEVSPAVPAPKSQDVRAEQWRESPSMPDMALELTPALSHREFSPMSTALNTPCIPAVSDVPRKLGSDHQPGLFQWLPADSEHDWQRFITSMKWNELEQSPAAFSPDIAQWVNNADSSILETTGSYSNPSEVFYGSEVCAPLPAEGQWVHAERADTATSSPHMSAFEFTNPPPSHAGSSHTSPGSSCDAEMSDSSSQSMPPYSEVPHASSSQVQLNSHPLPPPCAFDESDASSYSAMSDGQSSKPTPRIRCEHEGCDRSFKNEYTYSVHASVHARKKKRRFDCAHCSETFSRRHDMMRHEVSQHGKVPDWTCDRCRRFFSSEMTLKNHKCPASRKATRSALPPLPPPPHMHHHPAGFQA
ncbi:hypothetical protein GLOTRDRAFT_128525 [Gloeophyllum trabeum ATCC 11539]|uniref:C2H2-type domain-containing protein n=1 Tax=Gloeophyllum trabeum (strain ATCC 11539 / FP-39264 / Madison 617) TaxID=670483 RepID=S7RPT3_GLOTA|nr:uncharacterized protein GLOTRDRAFT_128525 [Gloeophyllum trabeum ATCC 11539]EPQ56580.1 hypothetical protein GLOTRDRAFT_128525 [Gloeophyllum trabeum ATCC 11539]